jgi:hypothetical protein
VQRRDKRAKYKKKSDAGARENFSHDATLEMNFFGIHIASREEEWHNVI